MAIEGVAGVQPDIGLGKEPSCARARPVLHPYLDREHRFALSLDNGISAPLGRELISASETTMKRLLNLLGSRSSKTCLWVTVTFG